MLKEFREFIARGNVVDLAVGVIIGAAFGKIVTSLVDQVIMPPIGLLTGGVDFAQLKIVLQSGRPATKKLAEVAIGYGAFLNTIIQFLIVAFVIFLMVKLLNSRAPPGGQGAGAAARAHAGRDPARRDPRPAEGERAAPRPEADRPRRPAAAHRPDPGHAGRGRGAGAGPGRRRRRPPGGRRPGRRRRPRASCSADLPPRNRRKEVLEHFSAMINDEF